MSGFSKSSHVVLSEQSSRDSVASSVKHCIVLYCGLDLQIRGAGVRNKEKWSECLRWGEGHAL